MKGQRRQQFGSWGIKRLVVLFAVIAATGFATATRAVTITWQATAPSVADPLNKLDIRTNVTERDVKQNRRNTQTFAITPAMGTLVLEQFYINYNKIDASETFDLRILEVDAAGDTGSGFDAGDVNAVLLDVAGLSTPASPSAGTGNSSGDVQFALFDLIGTEEVTLVEGKVYGIEFNRTASDEAFAWAWNDNNPYSGGHGYSSDISPGPSDYGLVLFGSAPPTPAIPEPASALLALLGLGGAASMMRRRRGA